MFDRGLSQGRKLMPKQERMIKEDDRAVREGAAILIAEDHAESRELLRVLLEGSGYRVLQAEDGLEAVELAKREHPDLILTDLHMPGLNGVEAILRIREIPALHDVPILAMSGDGLVGMELFLNIDRIGGGFIDYIAKPFNLDSILEQINELLVHETAPVAR